MTTSKAAITDSVTVFTNTFDDANVDPDAKGPDPDRLADHAAETEAFAARMEQEQKDST